MKELSFRLEEYDADNKINAGAAVPGFLCKTFTTEELEQEYDYYMAQKLLEKMLGTGLISVDEFNKITAKNRQTFSPFLSEIMPKMT